MSLRARGQSTLEFTFSVVATMFLIYGMIMIFRWAGMDLANRRVMQDNEITCSTGPENDGNAFIQLNAGGDILFPMDAVYHGTVSTGNSVNEQNIL